MSDDAITELITYLLDYFPNIAIDEIDNAVKMSAAGLIFDERSQPVKSEHYQNFGAIYLSNILKPYQNYRGTVVRKYYDQEDKLIAEEKQAAIPKKTPEEEREILVALTLSNLNSYKINPEGPFTALHLVYDFLEKEGKINYTKEKKLEFQQLAKSALLRDSARGGKAKSMLDVIKTDVGLDTINLRAKGLAVRAYYKNVVQSNIDLADILVIIK